MTGGSLHLERSLHPNFEMGIWGGGSVAIFRYVYGTTANGCSGGGGKVWLSSGMYTVRLLTAVLGGGKVWLSSGMYTVRLLTAVLGGGGESVAIFLVCIRYDC